MSDGECSIDQNVATAKNSDFTFAKFCQIIVLALGSIQTSLWEIYEKFQETYFRKLSARSTGARSGFSERLGAVRFNAG